MRKIVLTTLAATLLTLPVFAQGVKLTLTDGSTIQGQLEGYEHGRYRIKLPNGTVREIEEQKVQDIVLTERPVSEKPSAPAASAADEARAAFERGDFEGALQKIAVALRDLEKQREDLNELAARIAQAHFERLLEKRDAARLADALRRYTSALPAEPRRELLTRLAERFADQHRAAPDDAFTASFAELLARLADEGTISEAQRGSLADLFVQLGHAAAEKKNFASAATLLQGALKVDRRRREAIQAPLLSAMLALGKRLLEGGDGRGAAQTARDALALDAANAEARALLEDADFIQVRREVDAAYGAEAGAILREFMARTPRAEYRTWAEQALARLSAQPQIRIPEVSAQMRKYFPIRPGRFMLYKRQDGEIQERIRTDAVTHEGEVTKVYSTLKEIYRDWSTSKAYLLEIEKDAIVMATGPDREPILKFPLRAGEGWTWQSKNREFRRTVRSLGETVALGRDDRRQTYTDCLVVEFTSTLERDGAPVTITSRSTYAPGVGLVKLEFLDPELQKFNLELVETGTE